MLFLFRYRMTQSGKRRFFIASSSEMTLAPYILYIEDERPAIDLITQALEPEGFEVDGAISGEIALASMRRRKPDLILLDLLMPDQSGIDVYRQMKQDDSLADIPVIVISAVIPKQRFIIADDLPPVNDYITKPFKLTRLFRAIDNVLQAK